MTNSKLVIGLELAATALVLFLTNAIGGPTLLRTAGPGLAAVLGISAIVLATAAFAVSWKHRSFLVAGMLAAGGITFAISGLIALANMNFAVIAFPGPILGVILGLPILGLGVVKGIRTARTMPAVEAEAALNR
ncbi:MAG: hypothetical protein ACJ70T_07255 [Nitrososphaera sp.]